MVSAEGLGRIEIETDGPAEPVPIWVGTADVKDCFHRIGIPRWMSRLFGMPPVQAWELGITEVDGRSVSPADWLYPMPRCLPMGCSWSLFYAQDVDETAAAEVVSKVELLKDRGRPLVLRVSQHSLQPRYYVYVDNVGVIGADEKVVRGTLADMVTSFEKRGLAVHEVEVASGAVEALGVVLDGRHRVTRLTLKRFWRVHGALEGLVRRRAVTGQQLEVILGHATFCGLLRRETLSVFHACYSFVRSHYEIACPLWPTVRDELVAFKGLMITLISSWSLPWNEYVMASDACPSGYGITQRVAPAALRMQWPPLL